MSRLPHRSVRRRAERGDPDRVLVRRAGRRAAAHAALLVALSFLLCAGLVLLIVITGQQHAADNALRAATGRADDMIDPPQGIALLLQHADGHVQTSPGGGADLRAVQLPSGGRSSDISSYAAPQLRTEVLAAQSASIDTVSGASFTSEGYARSVQAALDAAHR